MLLAFSVFSWNEVNKTTGIIFDRRTPRMQTQDRFTTETRIVPFGDRTIRLVSHTPILTPKERERRKREIEQRLFDVFIKYADKTVCDRNLC
jgi:hypothetical protein